MSLTQAFPDPQSTLISQPLTFLHGGAGWDVFISYGHADADWVGTLAANLHRVGFNVFYDVWELVGGDPVTGRLEEGLKAATHGILVVSPFSLSRGWVQEEYQVLLRQAVENPARRLIPVLYRDAELPPLPRQPTVGRLPHRHHRPPLRRGPRRPHPVPAGQARPGPPRSRRPHPVAPINNRPGLPPRRPHAGHPCASPDPK